MWSGVPAGTRPGGVSARGRRGEQISFKPRVPAGSSRHGQWRTQRIVPEIRLRLPRTARTEPFQSALGCCAIILACLLRRDGLPNRGLCACRCAGRFVIFANRFGWERVMPQTIGGEIDLVRPGQAETAAQDAHLAHEVVRFLKGSEKRATRNERREIDNAPCPVRPCDGDGVVRVSDGVCDLIQHGQSVIFCGGLPSRASCQFRYSISWCCYPHAAMSRISRRRIWPLLDKSAKSAIVTLAEKSAPTTWKWGGLWSLRKIITSSEPMRPIVGIHPAYTIQADSSWVLRLRPVHPRPYVCPLAVFPPSSACPSGQASSSVRRTRPARDRGYVVVAGLGRGSRSIAGSSYGITG